MSIEGGIRGAQPHEYQERTVASRQATALDTARDRLLNATEHVRRNTIRVERISDQIIGQAPTPPPTKLAEHMQSPQSIHEALTLLEQQIESLASAIGRIDNA